MKILLTGSSGMVGRNILDHPSSKLHNILAPSKKELNLLDPLKLKKYIELNRPEMVIHAAGIVGGIQANMNQPVKFLVENLEMGVNVLMSSKSSGVRNFINISSSCIYPKNAENPLIEELILKGEFEPTNEAFAIAKVAALKLCEYISKENLDFSYKTIISCNLYGKFDKFDSQNSHMIPAVIKKISEAKKLSKKSVDIWGDGLAKREFMYAGDFADFIFYSVNNFDRMPQLINVGLGHDYSINEYYEKIAAVLSFKGDFVHNLSKPVGMKRKLLDDSRLKKFGWNYKTNLKDGITQTYEYFINEVGN